MVLCRRLIVDCKSKTQQVVEEDMALPTEDTTPVGKTINVDDVNKLVAYAKTKGWI